MRQCPHCQKNLDVDQGITRDEFGRLIKAEPRLGDVTLCCECGEFCEFGPRGTLLKIEDQEKLNHLKDNPDAMMAKSAVAMMIKEKTSSKHFGRNRQILQMAAEVKEWAKNNSNRSPMIQRNHQQNIAVIGTISDAIKAKFISVNNDAMLMFQEIGWLVECERMPTVFMVEAAIELAFKDNVDEQESND